MPTSESIGSIREPVTGSRGSTSAGYRDAWLMAMEKEGLRTALAQVRRFELGGQQGASSSQGDVFGQPRTGQLQVTRTAQQPAAEIAEVGVSETKVSVADRLPITMAVEGISRAQPLVGTAPLDLYTKAVTDERAQRATGRPATPASAPEEVKPSRLTVINGETGTEVWVRDAAMSAGEGRLLRSRISDALAALGSRIKRFSLNGKAIYQAGRVSVSTLRDSEK